MCALSVGCDVLGMSRHSASTRRIRKAGWLLSVDASAWPALQVVADLPDRSTADAVLTALLRPVLAPLQALCGAVRVHRSNSAAPAAVATVLGGNNVALSLTGCSAELAAHIRRTWPGPTRQDMWAFAPLRLQGQLVLMTRSWSIHVLSTLECGDLVLPPTGSFARVRWCLGVRNSPNWPVRINMKEHTVQIEGPQQLSAVAPATGNKPVSPAALPGQMPKARPYPSITEGPPAAWSTLELPVTFEIDTARILLTELAALRAGSAIELDQPLDEAVVRMVCQGQTVGEGQLVAIGERLGVRITRIGLVDAGV
jgi:type III secretion protein Q